MIDYEAERKVAELATIVGLAGGGIVGLESHNWGWALFATLAYAFFAWTLMQLARTEPRPSKMTVPTSTLDVLNTPRQSWPPRLHEQEYEPWPPPLYERQMDDESRPPVM